VVGDERAVWQHRALRRARGARGVEQHGQVLAACARLHRRCPVDHQGGERLGVAQVTAAHRVGAAKGGQLCAYTLDRLDDRDGADHDRGARVGELAVQLARGVAGIHRHGDQAGPEHGEEGDRELRNVRQGDRHPGRGAIAVGEVQRAQAGRDGVRPPIEIAPGQHGVV
jgi:hypothetical protein